MPRPIKAILYPEALTHNLQQIRTLAPRAKIWSVIKANGYGHGIHRIYSALSATDGFAVLDLNEAVILRQQGWKGPILLLEGFFHAEDLMLIDQYRLTTVIHNAQQLALLAQARLRAPLDIYLKINSGMNRLGFSAANIHSIYHSANALRNVDHITLMTHFANADNGHGISEQLACFDYVTHGLSVAHSLANSAATLWYPETHRQWIRPGIILYGASPSGQYADIKEYNLRPALALHSEIIAIQQLKAGDVLGYGNRYRATEALRIGIVACGYGDGYPRHAPSGTPVWLCGQRSTLLGAVSMDMLAIDLSGLPKATVGTPVELWGEHLPIDDVASVAGTLGYEMLCALAARVPVQIYPHRSTTNPMIEYQRETF